MKKVMAVAATLTMSAGLAACGTAKSEAERADYGQIQAYEGETDSDPGMNGLASYNKGNEYRSGAEAVMEEAAEEADVNDNRTATADMQAGSVTSENTTTLEKVDKEKLVYRCSMSFESLNYDESVEKIRSLIREYGGFVENEDVRQVSASRDGEKLYTYSATIRVPSSDYERFIEGAGAVGELKNKTQNVDNMTKTYTNLKAELEVLETKRQSYLEMMKEAKTLNDMDTILMIDDRLTQVEISINQLKTQMNQIDNDVTYSYISVSIKEVKEYEEAPAESFGQEVGQSLRNGWENFVDWLRNLVVYITGHLPQIGIAIVIILLVWFLVIRKLLRMLGVPNRKERKERRAARRAAKQAAKQAEKQTENMQAAASQEMMQVQQDPQSRQIPQVPQDQQIPEAPRDQQIPQDPQASQEQQMPQDWQTQQDPQAPQ